jgi:hypothetical protein
MISGQTGANHRKSSGAQRFISIQHHIPTPAFLEKPEAILTQIHAGPTDNSSQVIGQMYYAGGYTAVAGCDNDDDDDDDGEYDEVSFFISLEDCSTYLESCATECRPRCQQQYFSVVCRRCSVARSKIHWRDQAF